MMKIRFSRTLTATLALLAAGAAVLFWLLTPVEAGAAGTGCANGVAVPDASANAALVDDCRTLLSLKDAMAGSAVLNWSVNTPITRWEGVRVNGSPKRVRALNFFRRSPSLTGYIPPELGSLDALEGLNLGRNRLTGAIPGELARLANLKLLSLHHNRLSGAIPPDLGALTKLTYLRLYGPKNAFTGCVAPHWRKISDSDLSNVRVYNCRMAAYISARSLSLRSNGSVVLKAETFAPAGMSITYQWQELNDSGWSDLRATASRYRAPGIQRGFKTFRVEATFTAGPLVWTARPEIEILWDEAGIISSLASDLTSGVINSSAYRQAQKNLLDCLRKETGESFLSVEHALTRYTGAYKAEIDDCDRQHGIFEAINALYKARLSQLTAGNPLYAAYLKDKPYFGDSLGGAYRFVPVIDIDATRSRTTRATPSGGLFACLQETNGTWKPEPVTLTEKLDRLNCLEFDTHILDWKSQIQLLYSYANNYQWLHFGDKECSNFPDSLIYNKSYCYRHDVSYDTLRFTVGDQTLDTGEADKVLDKTWNSRNKYLADSHIGSHGVAVGCDPASTPVKCAINAMHGSIEISTMKAALNPTGDWPVTNQDIIHSNLKFDNAGNIDNRGERQFVSCRHPVILFQSVNITGKELNFNWQFDDGCVGETIREITVDSYRVCVYGEDEDFWQYYFDSVADGSDAYLSIYGTPPVEECRNLPASTNNHTVILSKDVFDVTLEAKVNPADKKYGPDYYPPHIVYNANDYQKKKK